MLTINTIIRELQDIPAGRLEEVYRFVREMNANTKPSGKQKKKILAFAGAFGDMSDEDYADFVKQTKNVRKDLFDRKVEL